MYDHMRIARGRELLALGAASCLVMAAWAGFPSLVDSNVYVPLPQASAPSAANLIKQGGHLVDGPRNAHAAFDSTLSWALSMKSPRANRYVAVWDSGRVVDASLIPLRSKLQALLLLLNRSDVVDQPALKAKIEALLNLPDFALWQLVQHPDLAEFSKLLDDVFVGGADVSGVETELDKVDVTTVPGTSDRVQLITVSGKPAYTVTTPVGDERIGNSALSPMPAPPPGELAALASEFHALSRMAVTTFALAPSTEELPPPPPPPPPPTQARMLAPALVLAPSSEELPPPPPPPTSAPPVTPSQPTGTPQTSLDVINSGNKFEPGETAAQRSVDNSPPISPSATQTAPPSTSAANPAEAGGVTGGGGETSPGGGSEGGTASEAGTSP